MKKFCLSGVIDSSRADWFSSSGVPDELLEDALYEYNTLLVDRVKESYLDEGDTIEDNVSIQHRVSGAPRLCLYVVEEDEDGEEDYTEVECFLDWLDSVDSDLLEAVYQSIDIPEEEEEEEDEEDEKGLL